MKKRVEKKIINSKHKKIIYVFYKNTILLKKVFKKM